MVVSSIAISMVYKVFSRVILLYLLLVFRLTLKALIEISILIPSLEVKNTLREEFLGEAFQWQRHHYFN